MIPDLTFSLDSELITTVVILSLWSLPWKGYALWRAARLSHRGWFIALLVINTAAILEIIYIFFIAKRAQPEAIKSHAATSIDTA